MMRKIVLLPLLALFFVACQDKHYTQPEVNHPDFNLFDDVMVNTNLPNDTRCLLFTASPYDKDGNLVAEPMLVAKAPFEKNIRIPKAVSTLYSYVNGIVTEHPRQNITLTGKAATRTENFVPGIQSTAQNAGESDWTSFSEAFVTAIYDYYPEAQKNVTGDDLSICTDLYAAKGVKKTTENPDGSVTVEEWGNTKVWVTYIGSGGTLFAGDLWYYTYQVDEATKTPLTSLEEIEANKVQVFTQAHNTKVAPEDGTGKRVCLGEFEPGTRIGFIYKGNNTAKYSTPYYNEAAYGEGAGHTCGIIRSWEYDGQTFATLGMENRLQVEMPTCDHDFNDMVCLIEADPICVENTIAPPVPDEEKITWAGYWLFEDNYPLRGDYDFNDLVVKYAVTEIGNEAIIDLHFMARGATHKNDFGVNGIYHYKDLAGFVNVYADREKVEPIYKQIRVAKADKYIPGLNNQTYEFDLNTYYDNVEDFPCVLEIPIVNGSEFRWCLEQKPIDAAYPRYKEWVKSRCTTNVDWYLDTPTEDTTWSKE